MSDLNRLQLRYWAAMGVAQEERGASLRAGKPQPQSWLPFAIGRTGVSVFAAASARDRWIGVELYLGRPDPKARFDWLLARRDEIEGTFGEALDWQRLGDKTDCRIAFRKPGADPTDETDWPAQHAWLCDHLDRLHAAFHPHVKAMPRDLAPVEP